MCAMPAAISVAPSGEAARQPTPANPRKGVLLAEDDDFVAGLLERILTRAGWNVVRAEDGAQAMEVFAANVATIAFAVLDCQLPDLEGATLCSELRRRMPRLPVILVSGRNEVSLAEKLSAEGATVFMPKPFMPVDVERHVRTVLSVVT